MIYIVVIQWTCFSGIGPPRPDQTNLPDWSARPDKMEHWKVIIGGDCSSESLSSNCWNIIFQFFSLIHTFNFVSFFMQISPTSIPSTWIGIPCKKWKPMPLRWFRNWSVSTCQTAKLIGGSCSHSFNFSVWKVNRDQFWNYFKDIGLHFLQGTLIQVEGTEVKN